MIITRLFWIYLFTLLHQNEIMSNGCICHLFHNFELNKINVYTCITTFPEKKADLNYTIAPSLKIDIHSYFISSK